MPKYNIKLFLRTPDRPLVVERKEIDFLEIKRNDYKVKHLTFIETDFTDLVIFEETNLSHGIVFVKSEFKVGLTFINVIVDQYDQILTPDSESIVFKDCVFHGRVEFKGNRTSIQRSLVFENCTFAGGLDIQDIKIEMEGLRLEKCTIHTKLDIYRVTARADLSLIGNTVNAYIRMGGIKSGSITFTQANEVSGHLNINNCVLEQAIIFNDGNFKEEVSFSLIRTKGSGLTIYGSTFEKAFTINYHSGKVKPPNGISKYHINGAKFLDGLNVTGIQHPFNEFPLVEEININFSPTLSGNILFSNLDVGAINLGGFNIGCKLSLQHLKINVFRINNMINDGGLIFTDLQASETIWYYPVESQDKRSNGFYVNNSNLGKTQLFTIDFKSFEVIDMHNVILTDIATSNVSWFTKAQMDDGRIEIMTNGTKAVKKSRDKLLLETNREFALSEFQSKKEIYRQLKFAAQKQGDIPLSHEFQRSEMEYYEMIVKFTKPRQWSEYLILYSSNSNNFGQSWVRAFWGLIWFSLLTYIPVGFLTSDQLDYTRFATSFSEILVNFKIVFYDNFKAWFILLNPTHRISELSADIKKVSSWIYFWDIISRVVISYFIFQMVSAFRKFSK
jgi:hypothetical protein